MKTALRKYFVYIKDRLKHSYLVYLIQYPHLNFQRSVRINNTDATIYSHSTSQISSGTRLNLAQGSYLILGQNVWVGQNVLLETSTNSIIKIGDGASVQDNCRLLGDVVIGSKVLLAPNIFISSGNHHFSLYPHLPIRLQDNLFEEQNKDVSNEKVIIDDDCWVGINTVIKSGVRIGKGAIIGANSVVTQDIPPYSIAAGIPAKVLKKRLDFQPPAYLLDFKDDTLLPFFYSGGRYSIQNNTITEILLTGSNLFVFEKNANSNYRIVTITGTNRKAKEIFVGVYLDYAYWGELKIKGSSYGDSVIHSSSLEKKALSSTKYLQPESNHLLESYTTVHLFLPKENECIFSIDKIELSC